MPNSTKESLIKLLLKQANLDLLHKNFSPVSNLSFISMLIKRSAASNIVTYAEENNLMEPNQSAYCQHFSTETSVLQVYADILKAMDKQEINCLILLALTASFDTTDHEILLRRLEKRFYITGNVNKWIESYITKWYQHVIIGDMNTDVATSDPIKSPRAYPGLGSWPHLVHTLHKSSWWPLHVSWPNLTAYCCW